MPRHRAVGANLGSGAKMAEQLEERRLLSAIPTPAHVVVVIEENRGYSEIIGSSQAPYINSLANGGALFTNSYAIEHPSQPNYLDLFSGSNQGITDDNFVSRSFAGANLGSELIAAGKTFVGYSEDLPSVGSQVETSGGYAKKHNPWSDFTNVPTADNQPYTAFPTNYAALPTVSIVVPNLTDDMHDGTIKQGDTWLQSKLGAYATWAKANNSLLIVTWDEDDGSQSNQIPTIFYGAPVVTGQYGEYVDHFGLVRTLEDMYGLPHAGASASATAISDVWQITLGTADVANASTSPQNITLKQDADHQHIDWTMGSSSGQLSITDPNGLSVTAPGSGNMITLNNANGNPLPNLLNLSGSFTVNGLSGSNPLAGTTFNLNRSTLYISYAGASSDPLAEIRGYLKNGYNNGAWNGEATSTTGAINSAAAAANTQHTTAIGDVDSASGHIAGQPVNTIELKYTLYGDTSLAGTVGFNDFTRTTQHYNQTSGGTWDTGDFNYDGSVNSADFTLLSRDYNTTLGSQATPAIAAQSSSISAPVATTTIRRPKHRK